MSDDFGAAMQQAAENEAKGAAQEPELANYFDNVGEFVETYLAQLYRRDLDGDRSLRWCPKWWMHAEGIARLEAMWRAWEVCRQDPGIGMSDWFLGHCDPHMRVLMSESGPFRHCRTDHADGARLQALRFVRPAETGEPNFWNPPTM